MIRLELLGGFRCRVVNGSSIDIPLAKNQGLLAIVGLSENYSCSRGRVVNLLWSTRSDEQARSSLRQSLWSLKRELGPDAGNILNVDRKRIALNSEQTATDVTDLKKLAASNNAESLERAIELYKGDLLSSLVIRDPAWEEWLTAERESIQSIVVTSLRKLIDYYAADTNSEKIILAGRRLLEIDPFQEEGHRALIRGYAESNQRALALKQYDRCREFLRRELNTTPEPVTEALFTEVKKRGDFDNQDIEFIKDAVDPKTHSSPNGKSSSEVRDVLDQLPRTAPQTEIPSLLVLPFSNLSGNSTQDYLAQGVTDNLIIALTAFRELFVFAYKTSMAASDPTEDIPIIAKRLGARYVVEGGFHKTDTRIRVTVRLVDVRDGRHLWADKYDRVVEDLFEVQDEIVDRVTNTLVQKIEETDHRIALEKPQENLVAYDFVLQGRVLLNRYTKEGELEARRSFENALELDPSYAVAYAGLAVSYVHEYEAPWCEHPEDTLATVFEFATKAVELDDLNIMGRYALASAYYYSGEYELANLEIEKAIAINPHDYHNVCAKAWFMTYSGHLQEGLACSIDAMRTNPYAADGCLETIGLGRYLSGQYDDALMAFGSTKANSLFKLGGMAACYAQLDRVTEAARATKAFLAAADQGASSDEDYTTIHWQSYWNRLYRLKEPSDRRHFLVGLKKAGIPVCM